MSKKEEIVECFTEYVYELVKSCDFKNNSYIVHKVGPVIFGEPIVKCVREPRDCHEVLFTPKDVNFLFESKETILNFYSGNEKNIAKKDVNDVKHKIKRFIRGWLWKIV